MPTVDFKVADMMDFKYPENAYDTVFAFASILHIPKDELVVLFRKIHNSLKQGGIFYISTKYSKEYREEWKEDEYGRRLFYFYSPEVIAELAKDRFEVAFQEVEIIRGRKWTEIALRKL